MATMWMRTLLLGWPHRPPLTIPSLILPAAPVCLYLLSGISHGTIFLPQTLLYTSFPRVPGPNPCTWPWRSGLSDHPPSVQPTVSRPLRQAGSGASLYPELMAPPAPSGRGRAVLSVGSRPRASKRRSVAGSVAVCPGKWLHLSGPQPPQGHTGMTRRWHCC